MERNVRVGATLLMALFLILTIASAPASASSATIPGGESFTYKVPALKGDNITFTWSTDGIVTLVVRTPEGDVYFSGGAGSGESPRILQAGTTGEYSFRWFNGGDSSASVSFHVTSTSIDTIRAPLSSEIRLLTVTLIILVIVVAILLALVVRLVQRARPPSP